VCLFLLASAGLAYGDTTETTKTSPKKAAALDKKDKEKIEYLKAVQKLKSIPNPGAEKIRELMDASSSVQLKYDCLLKLSEIQTAKGSRQNIDDAVDYLFQAILIDNERGEAYTQLGNVYWNAGRFPEAQHYFRKAMNCGKNQRSFDTVCLQAQAYMDQGNHFAAIMLLSKAAFSKNSVHKGNPYLINKLYEATSIDPDKYNYWALPLFCSIFNVPMDVLQEKIRNVMLPPGYHRLEYGLSYRLSGRIVSLLRTAPKVVSEYETTVDGKNRYKVSPTVLAGLGQGPTPIDFDQEIDKFELALMASIDDKDQLKEVMNKVNAMREEARKICAQYSNDKDKAEALFNWLKKNMLVTYEIVEGIPAENAVLKQKYLCLTGSLYYTLFAREMDLDACGMLVPGHAYCVVHDGNKDIEVQTTQPNGFGANWGKAIADKQDAVEAGRKGGGMLFTAKLVGEASPLDLIEAQYSNVILNLPDMLVFKSYKQLAKETISQVPKLDQFSASAKKERERYDKKSWSGEFTNDEVLKTAETVPFPGREKLMETLMRKMAEKDNDFRLALISAYDKRLKLMETALQLDPFNYVFKMLYCEDLRDANHLQLLNERKAYQVRKNKISEAQLDNDTRDTQDTRDKSKPSLTTPGESSKAVASVAKEESEQAPIITAAIEKNIQRATSSYNKYPEFGEIKQICYEAGSFAAEYLNHVNTVFSSAGQMTAGSGERTTEMPNLSKLEKLAKAWSREKSTSQSKY
jgi:tetratricopeptide (TPR) repeat protein